MFFRKKKPEPIEIQAPAKLTADKRGPYRVRRQSSQPIGACLELGQGPPAGGDCVDLSIGGAGVEFEAARDPKLALGFACKITIRALSRQESINASCVTASILPLDNGRVRYGFRFTNPVELYAQLDSFYSRLFNRRRHVRVMPDLDMRTAVAMRWAGGEFVGKAHDISEGGIGVAIPLDKASEFANVAAVDISFTLQGESQPILLRATVRNRVTLAKSCLLGLEFPPDGGIVHHIEAVRRYIERRLEKIQQWNSSPPNRKAR